jgi:outer membrane protein OmpA-like peptidoglycan-associated protein
MNSLRKIVLLVLLFQSVAFSFGLNFAGDTIQNGPETTIDNKQALFHPLIVFYQPDSYNLQKEDSISIIKKITEVHDNLSVSFIISAYTDPTGSESYNQRLSELRAEEVKKILIKNGIDETRIMVKAMGESCSGNIAPADYHKMRKIELNQINMLK